MKEPLKRYRCFFPEAWQRKDGKWYDKVDGKVVEVDDPSKKKPAKNAKKAITIFGDESSDSDIEEALTSLGITIDSNSDSIKYRGKKYKVNLDRLFESVGYLKSTLIKLGFKVTRNSYGDLKISK